MNIALDKEQTLHREAMALVDRAMLARLRGDERDARRFTEQAFRLEQDAALRVAKKFGPEPTRSVLLRSAATLALECDRPADARRLIDLGLHGDPPREIAEELHELELKLPIGSDLSEMVVDPGGVVTDPMPLVIRQPTPEYAPDDPEFLLKLGGHHDADDAIDASLDHSFAGGDHEPPDEDVAVDSEARTSPQHRDDEERRDDEEEP